MQCDKTFLIRPCLTTVGIDANERQILKYITMPSKVANLTGPLSLYHYQL